MQATRVKHQSERLTQPINLRVGGGVQACVRRCRALVDEGRIEEASAILGPATRRYPESAGILALHGKVLLKLGRARPAIGALMLASELEPDNAETLSDVVLAQLALGQVQQALPYAVEAFGIVQDGVRSVNLSCVLINLGAYAEALGFAEHALSLRADDFEAMGNRALALEGLGRCDDAIDAARRAVRMAPDNPIVCHNMAVIALASGHFTPEAWDLYEWRLKLKKHTLPLPAKLVRWDGEDIRGRTILLHAEQGLGDTLQFVRYAPMVAARGARVILAVQPALFRLLQDAPGVDQVIAIGDELPPLDVYCPLLSLPRLFGTTLATLPPVTPYAARLADDRPEPYLGRPAADPGAPGLRVGLVWAGNREFVDDRRRSLALADFEALAGIDGVTFYGLQYGQVQTPGAGLEVTDLMRGVQDFADTAERIAGLDLVIAADTAVAHLAATMGKPVWLLSRFRGCWRWLNDRTDSPWYPTLRLYRQDRPNQWGETLERVRIDLSALAAEAVLQARPVRERPSVPGVMRSCKVCGTASPAFDAVDFNKGCEDRHGMAPAPSGRSVTYHRCPGCALMFTGAFDDWTRQDFRRDIYNEGYAAVDPDYAHERPAGSLGLLHNLFGKACRDLEMLDYGGGDGKLAALLNSEYGGRADVYDPFNPRCDVTPDRTYRLITCFEVLEHCTDPASTVGQIERLLDQDGIVVFSTLLQPPDFMRHGLAWWYAAPRNGHVTLFSARGLAMGLGTVGIRAAKFQQQHACRIPGRVSVCLGRAEGAGIAGQGAVLDGGGAPQEPTGPGVAVRGSW